MYTRKILTQILLVSSCLLLCLENSSGQTNISAGNVSGTWTKDKSPYLINGNITIGANQKLTIDPGVEVRFSGSYVLSVQGCLNATGVEGDSIRFTVTDKSAFGSSSFVGWQGIRFQNVVHDDSSALRYCVLEYGKPNTGAEGNNGGALFIKGFGRLTLRNTTLRNNQAFFGGAIEISEVPNLTLTDILLQGNYAAEQGGGVAILTSGVSLIRCRLFKNTAGTGGGGVYVERSTVVIQKSIIVSNKGGAINAFWLSNVNIDNSTIAGNTGAPDGFEVYLSNLTCKNSILWNKTYNNTFSEIWSVDNSTVTLDYCIVKGTIESEWKVSHISTQDPLFTNLAALDVRPAWSGYPLKNATKSPAIDAGDPTSPHDPDGTIADIGALTFAQTAAAFPTVSFAADTTLGVVPFPVQFLNYTTQAQAEITSWMWDFGDKTFSTEKSPIHQYATKGIYDVKLIATNQNGKKDSLTLTKYVTAIAGTVINTPTVSGIWTKQNSPYNIYNTITVPAGKTLTIEPGVEVRFFGHHAFNVNGSLLARGTAADSILFDQFDDKSSWHSIRIENVGTDSDSTIFEYCRISHTNYISGDVTTNGGNAVLVKNFHKVRVSHCLLLNNKGGRGAGVYAAMANIKINDNVIRNNSVAQYGAGIYVESGSPLIRGNRIERNYGNDGAGGIWLSASTSNVENNIISYNTSYWRGGGVTITNTSDCTLLRNLISYNESNDDDAGGIMIASSSPQIINNTIAFNKAETGEGVLISGYANPVFSNTIIYGNRDHYEDANTTDEIYIETSTARPKFYNCDIQGGISGIGVYAGVFQGVAENNIDAAPLFKNGAINDLSLSWSNYPVVDNSKSPCIDAGSLESFHDPDGSPTDIGARYFNQALGHFPPRAYFKADTLLGYNTLQVKFTDLSDKGNGEIKEWLWAFGDNTTSTDQNPTHEYKTEGTFDVTLTIKDGNGFDRTITKKKYIRLISGVYIKGTITGTLTAPRYVIGGDLLVESGKTLTITPGVEMMFLGYYKLQVDGSLKATGTSRKPIVFTSYDTTGLDLKHATTGYSQNPVGWAGIYVNASYTQDSTIIDHCKVQFVENNGLGAIHAFSANGAKGMRVSNSEISYNSTQGITVFSSDIIIRNNYIHHNYARAYQKGAGIYFWAGTTKIINNIIMFNETADDGGGLCVDWDSRPSIIGNVVMYNKAWRAGGICDYSGGIELINNTIAYNASSGSNGGGYYALYAADIKFTNNIITNNTPVQIEVSDPYTGVGFKNCILQGGSAGISGYQTNIFLYDNVLTSAPNFVQGLNSYGRLLPGSPAINAGTTAGIMSVLPSSDIIGNTRVSDSQIDIGAYEYASDPPLTIVKPIADVNKAEDFDPFIIAVDSVFGYQYGAKFLTYSLPNTSDITLLKIDIRDKSLYVTPLRDRFGDQTVEVMASNGINQVTTSFIVHIAPVDDDPFFTIQNAMVVDEDFKGSVSNPINVNIPYGESSRTRVFTLEPSTIDFATVQFDPAGSLSFSAKPNLSGFQEFTLTLTEGQQSHIEHFTFAVQPVNDPPVITVDNTAMTMSPGDVKEIPVVVYDVEGDLVTLTSTTTNTRISANRTNIGNNQYTIAVTAKSAGSSGLLLSSSDGTSVTKVTIPITVKLITGQEEEPASSQAVYPNPAVDYLVIKAKEKSSIVLCNMNGELITQDKAGSTELVLRVDHLTSGIYLLIVDDGLEPRVYKIVKQSN